MEVDKEKEIGMLVELANQLPQAAMSKFSSMEVSSFPPFCDMPANPQGTSN